MYSCDQSWIFSIIIAAQETFIIFNVENSCAASYFVILCDFFQDEEKVQRNSIYLK